MHFSDLLYVSAKGEERLVMAINASRWLQNAAGTTLRCLWSLISARPCPFGEFSQHSNLAVLQLEAHHLPNTIQPLTFL